jgi:iron complex outermembrane recepter protein
MSELINTRDSRATIRWKLLTSASALALVSSMNVARAEDASHPLLWIELGGQMENVGGQGEIFAPPFLAANPDSSVLWTGVTPLQAQQPPKFSFGEEVRISFQPEGSDWVFSASARVGRSSDFRHVHHQGHATHPKYFHGVPTGVGATVTNFADTRAQHRENHAVLDFLAGKDVGLGMLGGESSSTLSFGVRFAQFTSKTTFDARARPDLDIRYKYIGTIFKLPKFYFHTYHATGQASRSFRGMGPSISWNGSTPFAGDAQSGEIVFDWGINASLLFGRQKTHVRHQETGRYYAHNYYTAVYPPSPGGHTNMRSITVPNVGGMAGISFRRGDAKVSFGYRADFFFGAVDGGIDTRKSETLSFKGPFASISVGLGN